MVLVGRNKVIFTSDSEKVVLDKYNQCLKRLYKACDYMDNPKIPYTEKAKYMDEFFRVIDSCRVLYNVLRKGGRHVSF